MRLTFIFLSVLFVASSSEEQYWHPFDLVTSEADDSPDMWAFFEDQKEKVEKVFTSSYNSAVEMKNSVNSYVEEQHKKITDDINNYVESVKQSGRNFMDTWSFVQDDDSADRMENPDVVLSVPAIVTGNGYPCETHTIVSKGYILNVHRVPHSKDQNVVSDKTVLLHHGLFASSGDWVLNGPERSLAYILADAGYDVWMANIRGNRYSREHAWLKTDSKSYWNFSWHDVAVYDVPEIIDYIMRLKGASTKITYIGHSMGTAILFSMLTVRPEYNTILNGAIAMAPTIYFTKMQSPLKMLAPLVSNLAYMEMTYKSYEFLPKQSTLGKLSTSCTNSTSDPDAMMCKNVIFYLCGYNEKQLNKTQLPVFVAHLGTGTSWKTIVHFAQEILSGKFQQFDYGSYHNLRIYNSLTPPEYDLSKVTLPMTLFWSQNDLLSSEADVKMLYEKLPKASTDLIMVDDPQFNHLDYLAALDTPTLINNRVLEVLEQYNVEGIRLKFRIFK